MRRIDSENNVRQMAIVSHRLIVVNVQIVFFKTGVTGGPEAFLVSLGQMGPNAVVRKFYFQVFLENVVSAVYQKKSCITRTKTN